MCWILWFSAQPGYIKGLLTKWPIIVLHGSSVWRSDGCCCRSLPTDLSLLRGLVCPPSPSRPSQTPPRPEHPCPSAASRRCGNNGHAKVCYRICISSSLALVGWRAKGSWIFTWQLESHRCFLTLWKERKGNQAFFSVIYLSNYLF